MCVNERGRDRSVRMCEREYVCSCVGEIERKRECECMFMCVTKSLCEGVGEKEERER